jgi:pyruvate ferredoxin oxidoreductase alpha subunit
MAVTKVLDGNEAAAYGVKLSRVEVIAAYPITPQTELANRLARFVAEGEIKAKYVTVESEHASMSVCAGASAAGARAFTASASQGIVYMEEVIWMVPGMRLPVVMCIANRSIAFPGALKATHSDSLLQRDSGWIQLYCENSQEVLDTCIQAYRIAEDKRVYLPVIFTQDGYVVTANAMPVEIPDQEAVDNFLPPYKHEFVSLDPDIPLEPEEGPIDETETECRYLMDVAMENAKKVIKEVDEEYGRIFGRRYGGLIEEYRCDGAEGVLITMGSITGTAREVVDSMRDRGKNIGLVKLKAFRPFPTEEIRKIAKQVGAIGFVDRNFSHGSAGGGIGCIETAKALYNYKYRPPLLGFIAGIGGRDVTPANLEYMAEKVLNAAKTGVVEQEVEWIQLRR